MRLIIFPDRQNNSDFLRPILDKDVSLQSSLLQIAIVLYKKFISLGANY